MRPLTQEWLNRARDDLAVIQEISHNEYLTNMVAFHAQQSIEKCLKAIVEEYELPFVKTHNLGNLLGQTKKIVSLVIDMDILKSLDRLYIDSRYPGDMGLLPTGKPSREEAGTFAAFAQDIYNQVSTFLANS